METRGERSSAISIAHGHPVPASTKKSRSTSFVTFSYCNSVHYSGSCIYHKISSTGLNHIQVLIRSNALEKLQSNWKTLLKYLAQKSSTISD